MYYYKSLPSNRFYKRSHLFLYHTVCYILLSKSRNNFCRTCHLNILQRQNKTKWAVCCLWYLTTTILTFYDTTFHVLFYCLYILNWLTITMAQWLKYQTCEPHITSSNPPGTFLEIFINFFNFNFSSKIA